MIRYLDFRDSKVRAAKSASQDEDEVLEASGTDYQAYINPFAAITLHSLGVCFGDGGISFNLQGDHTLFSLVSVWFPSVINPKNCPQLSSV